MPERISSVYDVPDWIAEKFPAATGPARAAYNSGRLPLDAGADLLRRGVHGALGLEEDNPYQYGGERIKKIQDAASATTGALSRGAESASRGASSVVSSLRRALMDAGARQAEPDAPVAPAPRSAGSGMDFGPARAGVLPARNNPTPAGFPREGQEEAGKRAQMQLAVLETELRKASNDGEALNIGKEIDTLKKRFPGLMAANTTLSTGDGLSLGRTQPSALGTTEAGQMPVELGVLPDMHGGMTQTNPVGGALADPAQDGAMVRTSAPRRSLRQEYDEAVAKIEKEGKGELSKEQKGWLMMELGTRMMAQSSKPGATMFSAAGEAGAEVSGRAQKQIETNRTREKESRREALDSAFRAMGLEGQDRDDIRDDRRVDMEEARGVRTERSEREKMDLLRQQVDQAKLQIKESAEGFVRIDMTGKTPPMLIKDPTTGKPFKPMDKSNPNIDFYKWMMEDPKRSEFFLRGKGKDEETNTERDLAKKKNDFTAKYMVDNPTAPPAQVQRAVEQLERRLRGEPEPHATPKTRAEAERIPKGTKYINPADGQVYTR